MFCGEKWVLQEREKATQSSSFLLESLDERGGVVQTRFISLTNC